MILDDIDTPVSDSFLSGDEDPAVDTPQVAKETVSEGDDAGQKTAVIDPLIVADNEPVIEAKPDREPVIPRARFDELNSKLHAEREENERLRAQLEQSSQAKPAAGDVAETVDIDALEQQYFDAMIDGNKDAAVKIRGQINREIRAQAEAEATQKVTRNMTAKEQEREFSSVAKQAVADYPFLDDKSEAANQTAIAEVVEWRDFYMAKGDSPAVALQKATAKVAPMYATAQPVVKDEKTAAVKVDTRKQIALERNLADSTKQAPAVVAGIGNRAVPLPKVETQTDWEKLSATEREEILMSG